MAFPFVEIENTNDFADGSFELLAGKSLHSEIGVMSKMKLSSNFKVSESVVIGVNLGGLYTD